MKWKQGRQKTGYQTLTICKSNRFKFDIHILKMTKGTSVPHHRDPIDHKSLSEGYKSHHRLNIIIKQAKGGVFGIENNNDFTFRKQRIIKFRPDKHTHWVTPVVEGTRYVLSIGWLSKNAD